MLETKESITRSKTQQLERTIVLDEATRKRRQRKALEALEKDNYQDDVPSRTTYVSDYRIQLNKKFQQKFALTDEADMSVDAKESGPLVSASSFVTAGDSDQTSKKKRIKSESKLRFKKNFATLLEEEREVAASREFSYFSISVPESRFPQRKFCSVCGFPSSYTCIQCGAKYCSTRCQQTHKDTRCLKWTV